MNIDYQIAKDYMAKLSDREQTRLCNWTLGEVQKRKMKRKEIRKFYKNYIKNYIKNLKFKQNENN